MSLESLRRQYTLAGLSESDMSSDPIKQFDDWLSVALAQAPGAWVEPNAMTLATSFPNGDVSARIVLLREFGPHGFVFYTSYDSDKGEQLRCNPRAALVFYWGYLERQVRISGHVAKIDRSKSEKYFHSRPRGSQLSAAISRQSSIIPSREALDRELSAYATQLHESTIPLPETWGGYALSPDRYEFWQGRQDRLHDRLVYIRDGATWQLKRLAP